LTGQYLEVSNVVKSFGRFTALDGVDLSIRRGEFVSLIGHSGCGKSTLLDLIAGLTKPTSGTLTLEGEPITRPGADRGMVFQHHSLLPWLSVYDNVYQAVDSVFRDKRVVKQAEKTERIERILRVVGLWEHRQKKPGELSGGMRQRCAVARAFAVQPRVLLLDEPFGAVDALTKAALHDELISLWSFDRTTETVIMVTHDIDEAIYLSDRIVVMTNGPRATVREVVEVPLARPRDKRGMLHEPAYADVKDHLLELLTDSAGVAARQFSLALRRARS
jgi:nitrate ABC transporter ATP-binding subunit